MRVRFIVALVILALGAAILAAGCGSPSDEIELTVHLWQGQAWTIAGDAADDIVCPEGRRQPIGWTDRSGTPLTWEEAMPLFRLAEETEGEVVEFAWLYQFVCADGSGTFVTHDVPEWDGGTWRIVDGTHAFAELHGSGTCDVVMAPPEPGEPPGEWPARLDCTGTVGVGPP